MKHEAERQIDDGADDDRDDVVAPPPSGIGGAPASLRRLSVMRSYTAQARIEPNRMMRAEIAVGAQMREGPDLHADQHRMLEHALDVAGDDRRRRADDGRPHQRDGDVARPSRRIPDLDPAGARDSRQSPRRSARCRASETSENSAAIGHSPMRAISAARASRRVTKICAPRKMTRPRMRISKPISRPGKCGGSRGDAPDQGKGVRCCIGGGRRRPFSYPVPQSHPPPSSPRRRGSSNHRRRGHRRQFGVYWMPRLRAA